jgi:glycerol-3-phosphate dehydrogenase (NAD(P)+)
MGSAITYPLSENGVRVRLWGTWLDDELVEAARKGNHPKLGTPLPRGVSLFFAPQLAEALDGADFILVAVTSEGFLQVYERAAGLLEHALPVFGLTKGFVEREGRVLSVSEGALELFRERFDDEEFLWVSVGGPVKAVELSRRIPTATVFGYDDVRLRQLFDSFPTSYYRVFSVRDIRGVELCSALKNVYAIGMGICDGLYEAEGTAYYHNFKAFLFNQAIGEMARLVEEFGGVRDTAFDLAGVGDLFVTSASGRNGIFGRRIGSGGSPEKEYRSMFEAGEVAEGYHTLDLFRKFMGQRTEVGDEGFPLLNAVHRVVFGESSPREELFGLAARCGEGR